MAKKRNGLSSIGKSMAPSFGGAMLRMIAIGLAGGIALIAGANKAGEQVEEYVGKHEAKKEETLKNFEIPLEEIEHYKDNN